MAHPPPDILLVLTTQWRACSCGFGGGPEGLSPELDRLAREAETYTNAVTPHPFGPFARAALLTGIPSPLNGVRNYHDPLPCSSRTLAHETAACGYETAFFGKWQLAPRDPSAPLVGEAHARQLVPKERRGGFGYWQGFEGGFLLNDPWFQGDDLGEPSPFLGYQSDLVVDRTLAWWKRPRSGAPRFAIASVEAPHPPYEAPVPEGTPPFPPSELRANVPADAAVRDKARKELQGYERHIRATDRSLARLLEAVRQSERPCVVVITSVHGDMHGAHGLFRKGWPHQESIGIPLAIWWPSALRRSGRREEAVSLLDIHELVRKVAAGETWELEKERTVAISMPSVVKLPLQCDREWTGTFDGRRKRVFGPGGELWLEFDLVADPLEMQNLA